MSRSGYSDGCEGWELIRWRGAVTSAIRGKRGQRFLRDVIAALDAIPTKRLVANAFEDNGEVCTLGAVAKFKGIPQPNFVEWQDDPPEIGPLFGIADAMAKEIMFQNDEGNFWGDATPEQRWTRMRAWAVSELVNP